LFINNNVTCYYEEALKTKGFPYAVVSGINIIDLASGDLTSFYLDVWTDEKAAGATEQLEALCDELRESLHNATISVAGSFAAHIGFENQNSINESEFDLSHRRLSFAARIFYY